MGGVFVGITVRITVVGLRVGCGTVSWGCGESAGAALKVTAVGTCAVEQVRGKGVGTVGKARVYCWCGSGCGLLGKGSW